MKKTQLYDSHRLLAAKMGHFAGYEMPLNYLEGAIKEHQWTRSKVGMFDVSHMGQVYLQGEGAAAYLEKLTPSAFQSMKPGRARYTVLTNAEGGIIDDLIVSRLDEKTFYLVINANRKVKDLDWIKYHLPSDVKLSLLDSRALIALQGGAAEQILSKIIDVDMSDMAYMRVIEPGDILVSRLGYTGEDGFELSVPGEKAEEYWMWLLAHDDVKPCGLIARDSLRLEMGYPLYGNDIDDVTSPVEAGLDWIISRKSTGFFGADRILRELEEGVVRKRVGIRVEGQGIARAGTVIRTSEGLRVGSVTSGGYSPTLKVSIGQGYVDPDMAVPGKQVSVEIREKDIPSVICEMPFITPKTKSMKQKAA